MHIVWTVLSLIICWLILFHFLTNCSYFHYMQLTLQLKCKLLKLWFIKVIAQDHPLGHRFLPAPEEPLVLHSLPSIYLSIYLSNPPTLTQEWTDELNLLFLRWEKTPQSQPGDSLQAQSWVSVHSVAWYPNQSTRCLQTQTIRSWTLRNISWHTPWTVFVSLFLNQIPKSHSRQLCVSYYKLNCDSSSCFQMKMHTALSRNDSFVKCWAHLRELCVNRITGAPVFMVSLQDLQVSTHFYSNRGVQNYACSLSYNMSQNKCKQKSIQMLPFLLTFTFDMWICKLWIGKLIENKWAGLESGWSVQ